MTPLQSLCLRHGVGAVTDQRDDGTWSVTLRTPDGAVVGTCAGRTLDEAVHAHALILDGSALMDDARALAALRRLAGHRYHVRVTWGRDSVELVLWQRDSRTAPRHTARAPGFAAAVEQMAGVIPCG